LDSAGNLNCLSNISTQNEFQHRKTGTSVGTPDLSATTILVTNQSDLETAIEIFCIEE
jgi:hypothetical protein